jgi:hypothetical protein
VPKGLPKREHNTRSEKNNCFGFMLFKSGSKLIIDLKIRAI